MPPVTAPIFANASGAAAAPRALVRLSGPGTRELAARLLATNPQWPSAGPARLRLTATLELPLMAITFASPRSYTGDDTLELFLAGGAELVRRVEARIAELGADLGVRRAEPGEFSARAYHAGKLTLEQAEGLAALIAAGSEEELASARRILAGQAGESYRAWSEELANLAALVEAGIDFADQEGVVAIEPAELRRRTAALLSALRDSLGAAAGAERSGEALHAVLLGAPNAGKSTLFNALLGRRRAVVSPEAGTTRDVLSEELPLEAPGGRRMTIRLSDVAGLDARPRGALDALGRTLAEQALERADIVVWCDASGRFDGAPVRPREGVRVIRVRTMCDRPGVTPADGGALAVCAIDGRGLEELRGRLFEAAWHAGGKAGGAGGAGSLDLLPRHREALEATAARLMELDSLLARDPTAATRTPEVMASLLREGLDALGALTGRVERDEVLGRIFAAFCIGK